jgi:hypothetical protein
MKMKMEDPVIGYPPPSNSGEPWKDKLFDWVVGRYKKHNHEWKKSDQRVWSGAIFGITTYFGTLLFFALLGWLLWQTNKLYGFEKAVLLALLMILFRVNVLIKQMVTLNRKF